MPDNFCYASSPVDEWFVPVAADRKRFARDIREFWESRHEEVASVAVRAHLPLERFIGLELSLVQEVERVFVTKENANEVRVVTIVNARDPKVRTRLYKREQAIIDTYPDVEFDFHISARMDRDFGDLMLTGMGQLVFQR